MPIAAALADRYAIFVRDPRTLAIVAELDPRIVQAIRWERRAVEAGPFTIVVPRAQIVAASAASGRDLTLWGLLEIHRDGAFEYAGIYTGRALAPDGVLWTLQGYELIDLLDGRVCGAETADARSGVGETVLKALVEDYLGATADNPLTAELTGKTFAIEADVLRGGNIEYAAQRSGLGRAATAICRQADLGHRIAVVAGGYEYRVSEPVDATSGTGAVPFAVNNDNVESLGWREDFRNVPNALICAGDGAGDARRVVTVTDTAAIAARFRREGVYDMRTATSDDILTAAGTAELARMQAAAVAAEVVPLPGSANARYRVDFDVNWDITAAIPEADIAAIDRRVAAIEVSLDQQVGERVRLTLGTERASSALRRIDSALSHLRSQAYV